MRSFIVFSFSVLIFAFLTACGSTDRSAFETAAATPATSSGFPVEEYPPALPTNPATVFNASTGCPNLDRVELDALNPANALLVINAVFGSGGLEDKRTVSDQAFWPLLDVTGRSEPWSPNWIEVRPASESPYAELIANVCSQETVELSWWVTICPGSCAEPDVAKETSLAGNAYLINRSGRWLLWAEE